MVIVQVRIMSSDDVEQEIKQRIKEGHANQDPIPRVQSLEHHGHQVTNCGGLRLRII